MRRSRKTGLVCARRRNVSTCAGDAWRLWGPYTAGRQWGTVREDYSADGDAWDDLVTWLRAFVRYAESKRNFLNELHEAFEKNPNGAVVYS